MKNLERLMENINKMRGAVITAKEMDNFVIMSIDDNGYNTSDSIFDLSWNNFKSGERKYNFSYAIDCTDTNEKLYLNIIFETENEDIDDEELLDEKVKILEVEDMEAY